MLSSLLTLALALKHIKLKVSKNKCLKSGTDVFLAKKSFFFQYFFIAKKIILSGVTAKYNKKKSCIVNIIKFLKIYSN